MLEEAANITGLHARRHEAELKLRAAEANLARAEDLRAQLESQLGNLKRQARQASRYRNISGAIRAAEAELLSLQRARVEQIRAPGGARPCMRPKSPSPRPPMPRPRPAPRPRKPPPRCRRCAKPRPNARTVLERHRVSQEQIAGEEQAARVALGEAQRRIGQLRQDLAHADQLQRDAAAADQRLAAEEDRAGRSRCRA